MVHGAWFVFVVEEGKWRGGGRGGAAGLLSLFVVCCELVCLRASVCVQTCGTVYACATGLTVQIPVPLFHDVDAQHVRPIAPRVVEPALLGEPHGLLEELDGGGLLEDQDAVQEQAALPRQDRVPQLHGVDRLRAPPGGARAGRVLELPPHALLRLLHVLAHVLDGAPDLAGLEPFHGGSSVEKG